MTPVKIYGFWRDKQRVGDVVVLTNEKCVVAYGGTVFVYRSFKEAHSLYCNSEPDPRQETAFILEHPLPEGQLPPIEVEPMKQDGEMMGGEPMKENGS